MKFIITEDQSEKLNHKIKSMVNKFGIKETLRLFDNNKDIIRRVYQDNPSEFLNQFNDLTPVEKGDKIFYVDKGRMPLFYYYPDEKNGLVYIHYYKIWVFFEKVIGLENKRIQGIMKDWLEETYDLTGLTPTWVAMQGYTKLEETYNIK
jgi:hypothetical protein